MFLPFRSATTALLLVGIASTTGTTKAATIIDLSQEWKEASNRNKNKAYCTIQANLNPSRTRGYVVIQGGEIKAEAYTEGSSASGKYDAWSATKSWSTFFIGVLVDQGKLTITETLGDIFTTDADWDGVNQVDEKKSVRVDELLTMTSGLVSSCSNNQESLQQVLSHVEYRSCQKGEFNYLARSHLLARIIERRSGQSPRQFAQSAGIFTKLGMADSDFEWTIEGGIEGSAYGLQTNPRILAKLGQLYLQGGLAASGDQLVSKSWVDASGQGYVDQNLLNSGSFTRYGYQWYVSTELGAISAFGKDGQVIAYVPASDTTVSIMGKGIGGSRGSIELLNLILANLGDLSVDQDVCTESFSAWLYFLDHPGEALFGTVANTLRGITNHSY